jgi:hypothetical protein
MDKLRALLLAAKQDDNFEKVRTLLMSSLAVAKPWVLVLTSKGKSTLSQPQVQRMGQGFAFSGHMAETTRKYVALQPRGIADT